MTRDEAKGIIAACSALWPHSRVLVEATSAAVDVWANMLQDVAFQPTLAAATALSAEGREHAPPVGALRRYVLQQAGELPPSWEQAWGKVREEISRCGRNGYPVFTDPSTRDAVRALGWTTLCMGSTDVMPGYFRKTYEPIADRYARERLVPAPTRAIMAAPPRSLNA